MPNKKTIIKLKFTIILFTSAFILNFLWENLHSFLYSSNNIGFNSFLTLMLYASFIDAFLILSAYFFIAIIFKDFYWINSKTALTYFILISLIIAIIIEIRALLTNRWTYSKLMPTIFSIGLTPLIQLAITGLIAIAVSRKISGFLFNS